MTCDNSPSQVNSAKNSKHQNHWSMNIGKATINALEELTGLFGPCEVTFHSQDDKVKVPIGITAASRPSLTNAHGVQAHLTRPRLYSGISAQVISISNW